MHQGTAAVDKNERKQEDKINANTERAETCKVNQTGEKITQMRQADLADLDLTSCLAFRDILGMLETVPIHWAHDVVATLNQRQWR